MYVPPETHVRQNIKPEEKSLGIIESFFTDPKGMLIFLLLAMPGRIIALSAHEFAHAWMADRCGDPTARYLGRLTLNPLKHIDIVGLLMMLFVGIGWAKPVPVNPINYRNYRKDDLKVSIAGVTMNFILFVLAAIVMFTFLGAALAQVPQYPTAYIAPIDAEIFTTTYEGSRVLMWAEGDGYYYNELSFLLANAPYAADYLITPVFGQIAGYIYQMLGYFVVVNIMLAVFNLIPLPPLDGYHVLNDLVLKRSLFADQKGMLIGTAILYGLFFTNILDKILAAIQTFIFTNIGSLAGAVYSLLGII